MGMWLSKCVKMFLDSSVGVFHSNTVILYNIRSAPRNPGRGVLTSGHKSVKVCQWRNAGTSPGRAVTLCTRRSVSLYRIRIVTWWSRRSVNRSVRTDTGARFVTPQSITLNTSNQALEERRNIWCQYHVLTLQPQTFIYKCLIVNQSDQTASHFKPVIQWKPLVYCKPDKNIILLVFTNLQY